MPEPGALSDESLPLDAQRRMDAVCVAFEAAWQATSPDGSRPRLEDYLTGGGSERAPLLCELLKLELHYRRGEGPTREEYLCRFPADGTLLGPLVNSLRATAADPAPVTGIGPGEEDVAAPTSVKTAVPGPNQTPAGPASGELPSVPGYEVLGVQGRGGMGVVYKARQTKLNRLVALKMLRAGQQAGEEELARFRAEAEAVARLQHPNIVQIYEVGEAGGLPFFALEYIEGSGLSGKLDGTPWPARQAAGLMEVLARALDAAHRRGIVHRDATPANVLLAADGTPKWTDFGLAKRLDADVTQTQTGAILGTPPYMAPEAAAGRSKEVGPAADVYGAGAILYELLTGRPPFRAETVFDTMQQVLTEEPVPPGRLNAKVPRDLETICLKCLHKEPARRYGSAQELAADLRRFQEGKPIVARPVGWLQKGAKWARRNPAAAAFVAALVVGTVVSTCLAFYAWQQATQAVGNATAANEAKTRAENENDRFRHTLYAATTHLAYQAWQDAHVGRALELLNGEGCLPTREGEGDLRGWEWYYLRGLCHKDVRTLQVPEGDSGHVAFSPDGRCLACSGGSSVYVWDISSGQRIRRLTGHGGRANAVAYSPDGRRLATTSDDCTIKVWDTATGKELLTLRGHTGWVRSIAFNSDGRQLVSAGGDGIVILWDPNSGEVVRRLTGHADLVNEVAFSPDDRLVASACNDQSVRLWSTATGQQIGWFAGHTAKVTSVAFSPNGKHVATGSEDYTVRMWDIESGREVRTLNGHTAYVWSVAFSPDGRWLASTGDDATVKLWDAATGREIRTLRGHTDRMIRGVAFSPDGHWLASAGIGGFVKVWDTASGPQEFRALGGDPRLVVQVAFSADGRRMASASRDNTAKLWDVATGREIRTLRGHAKEVWCVAFTPDGRQVVSAGDDGTVKLWNAETGQETRTFRGHWGLIHAASISPDGKTLASGGADQMVRVWDLASGKEIRTLEGHKGVITGLTFTRDGRHVASSSGDQTVKLWDVASGKEVQAFIGHTAPVQAVAFSPDGKTLASAGNEGTVKLWDVAGGREIRTLRGHADAVFGLAFSPSGQLASASGDHTVKLWDTLSGHEVLTLKADVSIVYAVAFSPDGRWLASGGANGFKLWDAPPRQ